MSHEWAGGWARERVESYRLGVAKWTRGNPHAVIRHSYILCIGQKTPCPSCHRRVWQGWSSPGV